MRTTCFRTCLCDASLCETSQLSLGDILQLCRYQYGSRVTVPTRLFLWPEKRYTNVLRSQVSTKVDLCLYGSISRGPLPPSPRNGNLCLFRHVTRFKRQSTPSSDNLEQTRHFIKFIAARFFRGDFQPWIACLAQGLNKYLKRLQCASRKVGTGS